MENTNKSIEEIRVNLTVKLDNAVQNIENARHNTESLDLRMEMAIVVLITGQPSMKILKHL